MVVIKCNSNSFRQRIHSLIFIVILSQVKQAHSASDVPDIYTICLTDAGRGCDGCQDNYTNVSDVPFPRTNGISQVNVKFCSEEFYLKSVLTITNSNYSITVTGFPTKVVCDNDNDKYAGIHINGVNRLTLQGISITSCGSIFNDSRSHQHDNQGIIVYFMSSIFISKCQDITIENVAVSESQGNGLTMFDNKGTVTIHNCTFKDNKPSNLDSNQTFKACGSGLHIVLSYCQPRNLANTHICRESDHGVKIAESVYNITKCNFAKNSADAKLINHSNIFRNQHGFLAEGFNRGGGLSIVIDKHSIDNKVLVVDSKFTNNSATWGGGLYVAIVANSTNNNVTISNCMFYNNNSPHLGGGGAIIGYQHYQGLRPQGNSITFETCSFENNSAKFGGGVRFYASQSSDWINVLRFRKCSWTRNKAILGSAVDISSQVWELYVYDVKTQILFSNCNFTNNYIKEPLNSTYSSYFSGSGAFLAIGYHIIFEKKIHFDGNNGSAMYLLSADIEFSSYSSITFTNNRGFTGGAINVQGFSSLILHDNISITFRNNSASLLGGAIFQQTFDKRDYLASQSCFVETKASEIRDINVLFEYNTAGDGCINGSFVYANGQSIFASTIIPCLNSKQCSRDSNNPFNCIGNFTFIGDCDDSISTTGGNITRGNNTIVYVIPGKIEELPISTWNDVFKEVLNTYKVTVQKDGNSTIQVDNAYSSISNKLIKFYGLPGDKAYVTLESIHRRKIAYKFQIQIQECPPGFVHDGKKCVCSVNTVNKIEGIPSCNEEKFEAQLLAGYWMGYDNSSDDFGRATDLVYSFCPFSYCLSSQQKSNATLPQNTSVVALDKIICGNGRTGKLCHKCRHGFFNNYHDYDYNCKNETNCNLGWLFFLVSEIVPVTVFFIVVILFNINFTDGAVSGFVLFVQISDTMLITANDLIRFPESMYNGLRTYKFIVGIFNLKFFAHNHLSFCLWRSASTLDLLAFKYITILYASTLVVIIIVIFKYCHNKRINNILVKVKGESAASIKSTIIHGVSGFLVICYSECTRISLSLLTPAYLYTSNEEEIHIKHRLSFYNGELHFFRGKHLFYALPALFIVLTFGLLPPLILISYPLCYKVFTLLKVNETKFTNLLCTFIPLEKFKPFFDSFQSSFKDEYRMFSGLYFFYRLTTLLTFAFIIITYYYVLVQIQFAVIFTVHVLCQPYKKRWHNILDGLLFLDLSLINILSMLNFQLITREVLYKSFIKAASSTVQIILLFLPLLYISLYSTVKVIGKIKRWKNTSKANDLDDYHKVNNFLLSAAEDRLEE